MLEVYSKERLEEETVSKNKFIERLKVKNPCSQNWDEMVGNAEVRFCSHCDLNVNNLSAMTRKQALKIARKSKGRICVRYVQNPIDKTPIFADRLYKISRRAGVAAGVLSASLTLSALSYSQTLVKREPISQAEFSRADSAEKDKSESVAAKLSGTITDSQGNFAENVIVSLTNQNSNESKTAATNNQGFYEFVNLTSGIYKLEVVNEKGSAEVSYLEISQASEIRQDLSLSLPTLAEVTIESGEAVYMTISGGIGLSISYKNPLTNAVLEDDLEEVKNLIAKGADVNGKEKDSEEITPLFIAIENGNIEIAETLLNFGAKINARDESKQTPLMRLDEDASPELVRLLIKHGAKINATDDEGNTPLIIAAENAKAEALRVLIENGAEINAKNDEGQTALMNAAYEDDLEKVRVLIEAGADVNLKNSEGDTAYDLTSDEEIENLLVSHGAIVEKKDDASEDEPEESN